MGVQTYRGENVDDCGRKSRGSRFESHLNVLQRKRQTLQLRLRV